jgi:hypothetical protein
MSTEDRKIKKREKFNESYMRITKKQYDLLSDNEKKLYDAAKENKNILGGRILKNKSPANLALISKKFKDRGFGRLKMVDSETYETVKKPMFVGGKRASELLQKRINRADTSGKDKSYLIDIGIKGPLPKPLPKGKIVGETVIKKNTGGLSTNKRFGNIDYRKGGMVYKNG